MCWILWVGLALWALPLQAQLLSPDKLAQPHAELEGLEKCTQCHQLGERIADGKCLECHDALAVRIRADLGYHANFKEKSCIDCHSDHRGLDYAMVRWDTTRFDHDSTGYALTGKHPQLNCAQCHKTVSYLGLKQDCLPCHKDRHRGQLDSDCRQCHSTDDWRKVAFEHDKARYHLTGKHQGVECKKCHLLESVGATTAVNAKEDTDGKARMRRYKPLPFAACVDCHADYHQGQFAQDCAACHGESGWKVVAFDHDKVQFALLGKHRQVECAKCHRLEIFAAGAPLRRYKPLPFANCADCHADPHRPSLGSNCESCHVVADWRQAGRTFDHGKARFQLVGKHQSVKCEACHSEGHFRDLVFSNCMDCHADYHQGQFGQDCAVCHGESGWKAVVFDHDKARFALLGKHQQVECAKCHRLEAFADGAQLHRYKPLPFANCADCHVDYHQRQFQDDCAACHRLEKWQVSTFDHDRSAYRLDGGHLNVECEKCHLLETFADGTQLRRYKPVATECHACHGAL